MSLLSWFSSGNSTLDWMRLAQEMAITASSLLRSSVEVARLPGTRAEVRGYLRAKSTPLVRRVLQLHQATHNRDYTEQQVAWLRQEVTERAVRMSIDDMLRVRTQQTITRLAA